MLPRHPRTRRFVIALLAAVQLAVPPLVGLADATLSARAFESPTKVHVEDYGRRDAVATHPDDCVLCQLLAMSSEPAAAAVVPGVARAHTAPSDARRRMAGGGANVRLPASRAPPSAS
ncbi:MAG: hypothetical protein ACYC3L_13830 [Gemmatimonadaceae bacterium]